MKLKCRDISCHPLQYVRVYRIRNEEEKGYFKRRLPMDIRTDTTEGRNKPDMVGRADI